MLSYLSTSRALETMYGNAGIVRRVLGVAVPEVVLHRPQIRALVGEVVAAAIAQHVGPDAAELRLTPRSAPHRPQDIKMTRPSP